MAQVRDIAWPDTGYSLCGPKGTRMAFHVKRIEQIFSYIKEAGLKWEEMKAMGFRIVEEKEQEYVDRIFGSPF